MSDHVFGQDQQRPGELRTAIVVVVTAVMMVVEIAAGIAYGSMALLADGLHMASHAVALGVTLVAYRLARAYATDRHFSFGTGKMNALGGFASAVLLAGFAGIMVIESVGRMLSPIPIQFDQALIVAVVGLVVNGGCALLLRHTHDHGDHDHHHHHDHDHHHEEHAHEHHHDEVRAHDHSHARHGHDHNLRAAYLHVIADALTSVLAIVALLAGKFAGADWLDPVMGLVGAALVTHWSIGLLRQTGEVLLDCQASSKILDAVRGDIEGPGDCRVLDLHIWSIGPGIHALEAVIRGVNPPSPDECRARIGQDIRLAHAVVEVRQD